MSQHQNVFDKNPVPGMELFNQLLRNEISCRQAAKVFNANNIIVSERNIQTIMKRIREGNSKPKQPKTPVLQLPPPKIDKTDLVNLFKKEYEVKDYSDVPEIDPVKLLDKQLHELEMLLINYPSDLVVQKTLIELEMKIAEKLFKMRPTSTEFNVNELLRKNDISVAFIMELDQKHPNLDIKISWLEFTKIQKNK